MKTTIAEAPINPVTIPVTKPARRNTKFDNTIFNKVENALIKVNYLEEISN